MEKDVSFHDLGHQTVQRATAGSHELKDIRRIPAPSRVPSQWRLPAHEFFEHASEAFLCLCLCEPYFHYTIAQYSITREKRISSARTFVSNLSELLI